MTVILHFQSTGAVPDRAGPRRMVGGSMTLGRSDQNDVVLPDPDKVISGRHCAIEDHGGNVVVIDFSTNGTFLNYAKAPLGPTPTPIDDGDILVIGRYELRVEIAQPAAAGRDGDARDLPPAARDAPGAVPPAMFDPLDDGDDFLDSLLGGPIEGPAGVRRDLPDDDGLLPPLGDDDLFAPPPERGQPAQDDSASALTGAFHVPATETAAIPDDWDLDLPDTAAPAPEAIPEDPFADPGDPTIPPSPRIAAVVTPDPAPVPAPAPAQGATGPEAAARAFLRALGAEDLDVPDAELADTMARMGEVMRTMIGGVREILMTRQSIKSEFRMQQTVISAGANNPLKFSVSVEQAIHAMVRPAVRGYLPAPAAAAEALDDIKAHEVATMTGMEAALKGVLARLDPALLTERIAADKSLRSVLVNRKARYWEVFEARYAEIADQAENDFHDLFSKEFARAYQAQLDRLKTK